MLSLSDLSEHAPAQDKAINALSSGIKSGTRWCNAWKEFRVSYWGRDPRSLLTIERPEREGPDAVLDVRVPDEYFVATFPTLPPKTWTPSGPKILLRPEYYEAENAALWSSKSTLEMFVVSGKPGIGKSVFLLWLLVRRLALKLPTALQVRDSYAILFHKGGVSELEDVEGGPEYDPLFFPPDQFSRRIWALVDSEFPLQKPASIFGRCSPFFVVNTTSPGSTHPTLLHKYDHEIFYMKPWSLSEVLQARPFLTRATPHTEHQLQYLHSEFGASPRDLANYAGYPGLYKNMLHELINQLTPDRLQRLLTDPSSHPFSHLIVTIEPSENSRRMYVKKIASRHVFNLLWEEQIGRRANITASFYDLFQVDKITTAAEWVFELRVHQLLRRKQTIQLFRIHDRSTNENCYDDYTDSQKLSNPMTIRLPQSNGHPLVQECRLLKNHYYCPKVTDLSGVYSLLLIQPSNKSAHILLIFRIMQNSKHNVNEGIPHQIRGLKFPLDTRMYYVAVTPEGVQPTITVPCFADAMQHRIAVDEVGDERILTNRVRGGNMLAGKLPVFHYPVHKTELFID